MENSISNFTIWSSKNKAQIVYEFSKLSSSLHRKLYLLALLKNDIKIYNQIFLNYDLNKLEIPNNIMLILLEILWNTYINEVRKNFYNKLALITEQKNKLINQHYKELNITNYGSDFREYAYGPNFGENTFSPEF